MTATVTAVGKSSAGRIATAAAVWLLVAVFTNQGYGVSGQFDQPTMQQSLTQPQLQTSTQQQPQNLPQPQSSQFPIQSLPSLPMQQLISSQLQPASQINPQPQKPPQQQMPQPALTSQPQQQMTQPALNSQPQQQMPQSALTSQPQQQMTQPALNSQPQQQMPLPAMTSQPQQQIPPSALTSQSQQQIPQPTLTLQSQQQMPQPPFPSQSQQQMPQPALTLQPQQQMPPPALTSQSQQQMTQPALISQPQQQMPLPAMTSQPQQQIPQQTLTSQPQQQMPQPALTSQPQQQMTQPALNSQPQQQMLQTPFPSQSQQQIPQPPIPQQFQQQLPQQSLSPQQFQQQSAPPQQSVPMQFPPSRYQRLSERPNLMEPMNMALKPWTTNTVDPSSQPGLQNGAITQPANSQQNAILGSPLQGFTTDQSQQQMLPQKPKRPLSFNNAQQPTMELQMYSDQPISSDYSFQSPNLPTFNAGCKKKRCRCAKNGPLCNCPCRTGLTSENFSPSKLGNVLPINSMATMLNPVPYVQQSMGVANGAIGKIQEYSTGLKNGVGNAALDVGFRLLDGGQSLVHGLANAATAIPDTLFDLKRKGLASLGDMLNLTPRPNAGGSAGNAYYPPSVNYNSGYGYSPPVGDGGYAAQMGGGYPAQMGGGYPVQMGAGFQGQMGGGYQAQMGPSYQQTQFPMYPQQQRPYDRNQNSMSNGQIPFSDTQPIRTYNSN